MENEKQLYGMSMTQLMLTLANPESLCAESVGLFGVMLGGCVSARHGYEDLK